VGQRGRRQVGERLNEWSLGNGTRGGKWDVLHSERITRKVYQRTNEKGREEVFLFHKPNFPLIPK